MKRIATFKHNPINRIRELIALKFVSDDVVRGLSADNALTFQTLQDDWTGASERKISSAVIRSLKILKGPNDLTNLQSPEVISDTISNSLKKLQELTAITDEIKKWVDSDITIKKMKADLGKAVEAKDEAKTAEIKSAISAEEHRAGTVDALITRYLVESQVIDYISLQRTVTDDMKDEVNDTLMSNFLREPTLFGKRWLNVEGSFSRYYITNGSHSAIKGKPFDHAALFGQMEIASFTPDNGTHDVRISDILSLTSPSTGKNNNTDRAVVRNSLVSIITDLRDYEFASLVDRLPSILPGLEKVTVSKLSDNKQINSLLTEAERMYKLYEFQLFAGTQSWIALLQLYIQTYFDGPVVDHFTEAHPNVDSTFDVKGIIKTILDLPVGPQTATLLSNLYKVDKVKVNKVIHDAYVIGNEGTHDEGFRKLFADLKIIVQQLYSFTKNEKFLTAYRNGAVLHKSEKFTIQKIVYDTMNVPVCLTQMGSLAGEVPTSYASYCNTLFIDWAFNRYNSSARTEIVVADKESDLTVIPYSYGQIDYHSYMNTIVAANLKEIFGGSEKATGIAMSGRSIPLLAIRRASPPNWLGKLYIDRQLMKWAPMSFLPIPPIHPTSVVTGHNLDTVSKQVIGTFELPTDSLPLEFIHAKEAIDLNINADTSQLTEVLGISRSYLKGTGSSHPSYINRFLDRTSAKNIVLVCPFITEDEFFPKAAGVVFYLPYYTGAPDISIVTLGYNQVPEADGTLVHDITTTPLRVAKILSDAKSAPTSSASKRIVAPMGDLSNMIKFGFSSKRKAFNLLSDAG